MTKRQTFDACKALAPDFAIAFQRAGSADARATDSLVASWTDSRGAVSIAMPLGALGRARVESALLESALTRLRRSAA